MLKGIILKSLKPIAYLDRYWDAVDCYITDGMERKEAAKKAKEHADWSMR